MVDRGANVVELTTAETIGEAAPLIIPLTSVETVEKALSQTETTFALVRVMLAKAATHGDAVALAGTKRVLGALAVLLGGMN